MKILLVETSEVSVNAVTVHVRNAMVISDYLKSKGHDCRLVWDERQIDEHEQFDVIMFFSATFYFRFEKFSRLLDNQKKCRIGWLTNEFELFQNNFLKGRTDFLITNFVQPLVKKAHSYRDYLMVNLNSLIANTGSTYFEKRYDICYYGTFRKYRLPYFKRWLQGDMILSTSKKNWDKFATVGCDCLATTPFSWSPPSLAQFRLSLYIEDTKTHDNFNHFANRFYEALNCHVVPVFDKSCINTIKKEGDYFIPDSHILEPEELTPQLADHLFKSAIEGLFFKAQIQTALRHKQICLGSIEKFLTGL